MGSIDLYQYHSDRARAGALSRAAINQMGIGPIFPVVSLDVVVGFSGFSCYFCVFLGGLSLHLNHLIQSRMEISYRLFGTLPIGLLLSNLDSRQLETSPMTSFDQFWNMSIFGNSRAVRVICQKKMPSENRFFLDEGATRLRWGLGGF